jgi:glycosyltransferase involved in cell wall biosynthesis
MGRVEAVISVIMPARNAESTIALAVRSTLKALPSSAELIIFLDGCTDRTREIAQSFRDPRVRIIEGSQKPVGVARALNKALEVCRGDVVARMDADDICLPWRFRVQERVLQSKNVDFVFSQAIIFGRAIRPVGFIPQFPSSLSTVQSSIFLCFGNPFVHPTMFARRVALESMGGYRQVPAEDLDLWVRAASAGKSLVRDKRYALLYRVHANQVTQSQEWRQSLNRDESLKKLRDKLISGLGDQTNLGGLNGYSEDDFRKFLSSTSAVLWIEFQLLGRIVSAFRRTASVFKG